MKRDNKEIIEKWQVNFDFSEIIISFCESLLSNVVHLL